MVEVCETFKFLLCALQDSLSLHVYEYTEKGKVAHVYTMKADRGVEA
jgi:hypothetical protein